MNKQALLHSIDQAKKSGTPVLGVLVQWTISDDLKVERKTLEIKVPNINTNFRVPRPVTREKQFVRAIQDLNRFKRSQGYEMRRVGRKDDDLIYAKVVYDIDKDTKSVEGHTQAWVAFNSAKDALRGDDDLYNEVNRRMDDRLWATEIRSMLTDAVRRVSSFSSHPRGGSYFIPNHGTKIDEIVGLFDLVKAHAPKKSFRTLVLPILGNDETKEQLADSYESAFLANLNRYEEKLEEFFADDAKKTPKSFTTKLSELANFKQEALLYESLLGSKFAKISNYLDRLEKGTEEYLADSLAPGENDDDLAQSEEEAIEKLLGDEDDGSDEIAKELNEKAYGNWAEDSDEEEIEKLLND